MDKRGRFYRCLGVLDSYCRQNSWEILHGEDGFTSRLSYKLILSLEDEALVFIKDAYDGCKSLNITTILIALPSLVQDLSNGEFAVQTGVVPSHNWERSLSWLEEKLNRPAENLQDAEHNVALLQA